MEINEKKLKNILKEQSKEFQKHTDIVLEKETQKFQKHTDIVLEKQNKNTDNKFDKINAILKEHKKDTDNKFDKINATLEEHNNKFDKINAILEKHKKDINTKIDGALKEQSKEFQIHVGALAEDFTDQIKLLAESIEGVQEKKVDKEEFETLENRVVILEANPA